MDICNEGRRPVPKTGYSSLLRPIVTTSAAVALGTAAPALAATAVPAGASPDPSPAPSAPAPDPYPAPAHRSRPIEQPLPPPATPSAPAVPGREPAAPRRAVHVVRHAHRRPRRPRPAVTARTPVGARRPELPPLPTGSYVFRAVAAAERQVPAGAALAVALLVLVSGMLLARTARTVAR